jgi:hypothetical protein
VCGPDPAVDYQLSGRSNVPSGVQLPARCKFCNALGTVTSEMTIVHGVTVRTWCCRACRAEWPLTPTEVRAVERRQALSSRVARTGQQRRSNSR